MNSLKEYGDLFLKLNLSELSIKEGDFSLVLRKDGYSQEQSNNKAQQNEPAPVTKQEEAPIKEAAGTPVKAPLLGIFEELSGDREPIKEGDLVKKGDVLCTIEAMKMLNEVVATTEGTVVKVLAKPGDLVEYNQELFIIE
jgi:acetyl-CoA carboxylase biotin carboxyl carrier protein